MWASDDTAPQQSANSEFLGLRMMVQRLSFSRTLLDFFLNAKHLLVHLVDPQRQFGTGTCVDQRLFHCWRARLLSASQL